MASTQTPHATMWMSITLWSLSDGEQPTEFPTGSSATRGEADGDNRVTFWWNAESTGAKLNHIRPPWSFRLMRKRREDKRKIIYLRRSLGPIKKKFFDRIWPSSLCQAYTTMCYWTLQWIILYFEIRLGRAFIKILGAEFGFQYIGILQPVNYIE